MDSTTPHPPHVVLIPSPGMGHLIPLVELAKLLHFNHHFSTTLLLPTSSPPTTAVTTFLSTLPSTISYTFLPPVHPTLLPTHTTSHSVIINSIHQHSLPSFRTTLATLSNVVAVITDLFGTDYFDVAREVGVLPYMYFTTNAFCMAFLLNLPELDKNVTCPYQELKDPLCLPGCVPLYSNDFDEPTLNRQGESYKVLLYHVKRYKLAEGILVNSYYDLEPGCLDALRNSGPTGIYPVGPIIQSGSGSGSGYDELECLSWLDGHPHGSVLYVSFGSGGTLSFAQINELAIGLERSGKRFLWVVRSPNDNDSCGSFFNAQNQDGYAFDFLPNGYVDRVKDRGLLVPFWAPQIKVLGHRSIGGFLTHCGWNSILESIVHGLPLIAWPLYAEQRMNAVMLNEGLKVALRPKENEHGLVEADEVAKVVNELFEGGGGEETRRRMRALSDKAKKARSEDGVSTKMLSEVVLKWRQCKNGKGRD